MKIFFGLFCLILILETSPNGQALFDYLSINGYQVRTTHQLKLDFKIDKSYKLLGKTNHQPTFAGKKFNVSLAAFAKKDSFVMIHAENHTDGSGGLDYSKLKPENFQGIKFNSREQCAELSESDIAEEHDLKFLKDNGFSPAPAVFIKQYFATPPDGTAEVVISFGERVANCKPETISEKFKTKLTRQAAKNVKIKENK